MRPSKPSHRFALRQRAAAIFDTAATATRKGWTHYCRTREEVSAIRDHCLERGELAWLGSALWTLASTGTRISEMTGLRWSNLNFQSGMVTLVDETTRAAAKRKGRQPQSIKNGRRRTFPIHADLRPVLKALPRHADGFVFRGPDGKQLTDKRVREGLTRLTSNLVRHAIVRREPDLPHASMSLTTCAGSTPVSLKSRPWYLYVRRLWSMPKSCSIVACRSRTWVLFSAAL